jgi:FKBP12-rapamycin complex-associated protein
VRALVSAQAVSLIEHDQQDQLTDKAVVVIRRVMDKLTGLDFAQKEHTAVAGAAMAHAQQTLAALDVPEQVDRLIRQATANENLCLSYFGWCPSW